MKRVSALLLTCTLGLSALSGCSASAAPQPLSAQPVTISEEEMMRYDLETPAVWSALSEFGLDLLKTARQEGEGTLLSPLSAALALTWPPMVLMGRPWTSSGRCWGTVPAWRPSTSPALPS